MDLHPVAGVAGPAPQAAGFDTAMAHLFRGEMHRMTAWRQRLDTTSNWAIVLSLGMTTFTLGSEKVPPYVLLLGLAAVTMCLVIEARRYQHLHHSVWRLRLIEDGYFSGILHERPDTPGWRERLSSDLACPRLRITLIGALRARLRRNYLMLMLFTTAAWLAKVFVHPASPLSTGEFYERLAVGRLVPSWFVVASASVFVLFAIGLSLSSPRQERIEGWDRWCGDIKECEPIQ